MELKYHFTCKCGEKFIKTNFDIEIARHRKKCPLQLKNLCCSSCDKQFANIKAFNLHNKAKHEIKNDLKYTCEECDENFSSPGELKSHIILHGITIVYCTICCSPFPGNEVLMNHMKGHEYKLPTENGSNLSKKIVPDVVKTMDANEAELTGDHKI